MIVNKFVTVKEDPDSDEDYDKLIGAYIREVDLVSLDIKLVGSMRWAFIVWREATRE